MHELVSIIIPTYNQSGYLIEAIDSALAQTYPSIEIIVINDGSTDDTEAVIAAIHKKHPNILCRKQENQGFIATVNTGCKIAQGEYILKLDGDDVIPTDYVQSLVACLEKARSEDSHVAYAYCDAHYFQERTGVQKARPFSLLALLNANYIHSSSLVLTSALPQKQFFNPNMVDGLDDWDLWLTLAGKNYIGVYCRDTYLRYRIQGTGRNMMKSELHKAMRSQIYINHQVLYQGPVRRISHFVWRVQRRLKSYL